MSRKLSDAIIREYCDHRSTRETCRILGISHKSIAYWYRLLDQRLSDIPLVTDPDIILYNRVTHTFKNPDGSKTVYRARELIDFFLKFYRISSDDKIARNAKEVLLMYQFALIYIFHFHSPHKSFNKLFLDASRTTSLILKEIIEITGPLNREVSRDNIDDAVLHALLRMSYYSAIFSNRNIWPNHMLDYDEEFKDEHKESKIKEELRQIFENKSP